MAWVGSYEPGDAFIEVILTGEINAPDAAEWRDYVLGLVEAHGATGVLADLTGVAHLPSIGQLTLLSVNNPYPPEFRRALLVPGHLGDEIRAYETPAVNRAQPVRLFSERELAVSWLTER